MKKPAKHVELIKDLIENQQYQNILRDLDILAIYDLKAAQKRSLKNNVLKNIKRLLINAR